MGDLVLVRAFCQLDFIRGNRYIDDAGKIMNEFDGDFPEKQVGVRGLSMTNKDEVLSEVGVSVERVWARFEKPDTLQYVFDQSWKVFKRVCEIIDVTEAKRFGLRLEHLYPLHMEGDALANAIRGTATKALGAALVPTNLGDISSFEATLDSTWRDLGVRLRVTPVRRLVEPPTPDGLPAHAIMFDADIHREDAPLPVLDIRKVFREGAQWVAEELPALAERVVAEVDNG